MKWKVSVNCFKRNIVLSVVIFFWNISMCAEDKSRLHSINDQPKEKKVCSNVYQKPAKILAASFELYKNYSYEHCKYFLQAPANHYIALNFSQLEGFGKSPVLSGVSRSPHPVSNSSQSNSHLDYQLNKRLQNRPPLPTGNQNCNRKPQLKIVQVLSSGAEKTMATICPGNDFVVPSVFQSNMPEVIVTYSWDPGTKSVVVLSFSFYQKTTELQSPLPTDGSNHLIEVIIIVPVVVFILLIIGCVLYCCYKSHVLCQSYHHRHHQHSLSDSSEHNQLQATTPTTQWRSHEVVYVPHTGLSHDRLHNQPQQWSTSSHDGDTDTSNLPPQIPISLDGEEGYQNSQRLLHPSSVSHEVDRETVNPPPNRTVFQGGSPPQYRAQSVGQLDKSRISWRPRAGRDCTSNPFVLYSHALPSTTAAMSISNGSCSSSHSNSSRNHPNLINNNKSSSSSSSPSTGMTPNGHHPHHNHKQQYNGGHSTHSRLLPRGIPVIDGHSSYYQGPPSYLATTSHPRSGRIFSDPSSSTAAEVLSTTSTNPRRVFSDPSSTVAVMAPQLRTTSDSTSSNSSSAEHSGYYGPPPNYSDLSDIEVFDVLNRPSPEAS